MSPSGSLEQALLALCVIVRSFATKQSEERNVIATPSARIDNTACTFLALRQIRSILCEFGLSDLDEGLRDALTGKGTGAHTLQHAFVAARPAGMTYSPAVPYYLEMELIDS